MANLREIQAIHHTFLIFILSLWQHLSVSLPQMILNVQSHLLLFLLIKNHRPKWASVYVKHLELIPQELITALGKWPPTFLPLMVSITIRFLIRSLLQSADQCVVTAQWTRLTTLSQLKYELNNKPALTACYPPQVTTITSSVAQADILHKIPLPDILSKIPLPHPNMYSGFSGFHPLPLLGSSHIFFFHVSSYPHPLPAYISYCPVLKFHNHSLFKRGLFLA